MVRVQPGELHLPYRREDSGFAFLRFRVRRALTTVRPSAAASLLGILGVALAGCGSSSQARTGAGRAHPETPGHFVTRILREEITGQWAAQWQDLHPGQQKLITRDQYVLCSERIGTNVGTGRERFTVHQIRNVPFHELGVPERTSKLVTISVAGPTLHSTFHVHAVLDKGRWRWVLGGALLRSVDKGRCLDGSVLSGTT